MKNQGKLEAIMWSIALPGFSQLLRNEYWKGSLFVFLEFIINIMSHFNSAIMKSFLWDIEGAIRVIDFQWLMFYPCLYMFAMWDAYKAVVHKDDKLAFLPFVFCAYFVTVGLMYSTQLRIFGVLFGPVFLPMLFLIPGLLVGFFVKYVIVTWKMRR